MISPAQLRQKAERKYGDFLKYKLALCLSREPEPFFPLEIKADKGSTGDDLLKRAEELAPLLKESKNNGHSKGYTLIFDEVKTRTNGTQTRIRKIVFETEEDYLSFVGKRAESRRMESALDVLRGRLDGHPDIFPWAVRNISALTADHPDEDDFWQNISLRVNWFAQNPDSGLYVREIPLPVHTKFIEGNKALILGLLFPENAPPSSEFERALGLRQKPCRIRFRPLDKAKMPTVGGLPVSELTLDLDDFARLPQSGILARIERIFVVENEMVYLTFPAVKNALCVWGHGFSVTQLRCCTWLGGYRLLYFGDLDEHGFQILSDFRDCFPGTESFCMTEAVFDRYKRFVVEGKRLDGERVPGNLTGEELALFLKIRRCKNDRLEQERIPLVEITGQV